MKKNLFYIVAGIALLLQTGCSQNPVIADTCYSDKLSDEDTVFTRMSVGPHFQGGNDSLNNFLSTNISLEKLISDLPQTERIYNDTARIKFVVSKQGSLSDLSVKLAKKEIFADEIARVIKKSSCDWIAGGTDNLVNGWFQFDIYFSLERFNNELKTKMTFNEYVPAD